MQIFKRLALVLIVVVAVGAYFYFRHNGQATEASTEATYYGNIEIRRVNLGFRVAGKLTSIAFEEGQSVRVGELIATLDAEPFEADVASATALREQARATLERLENGARAKELEQARALVEECRATLTLAESEFARNEKLIKNHAVSERDYDSSSASLEVAKSRLTQAIASLELLEEGARVEEIAEARAKLAQMDASVTKVKIALSDTKLYAPNDGVILTRVAEPGAIVSAGQTIATFSLQDVVWAYIFVEERDLCRLAPGMPAYVTTDASDKVYTGHIGYISPEAEFTPKTVETPNLRTNLVYRTRIVTDDADEFLRQGAPVDVRIPYVNSNQGHDAAATAVASESTSESTVDAQ
ncbi:MAG: efflux RND transporter periplasmic adaptor subunit [Planctomycetia bacterium]|nr:efflux RND transporter periplasmic adaptor subunit [Planctomycetia bacterium]